jgi:hypothetical protein
MLAGEPDREAVAVIAHAFHLRSSSGSMRTGGCFSASASGLSCGSSIHTGCCRWRRPCRDPSGEKQAAGGHAVVMRPLADANQGGEPRWRSFSSTMLSSPSAAEETHTARSAIVALGQNVQSAGLGMHQQAFGVVFAVGIIRAPDLRRRCCWSPRPPCRAALISGSEI